MVGYLLQGCNQGVHWVGCLIRWLSEGRITFQGDCMTASGIQCLTSCWTQVFSSLLTLGQRLPSSPCMWTPPQSHVQYGSLLLQSKYMERVRESTSKMEVTVFYNLILRSLSHHICHMLFIRSYSVRSSPGRREGNCTGV